MVVLKHILATLLMVMLICTAIWIFLSYLFYSTVLLIQKVLQRGFVREVWILGFQASKITSQDMSFFFKA